MAADKHTFLGKRKVCSIDICDFTDIQGIGNDPLYKRYASVRSIIDRSIAPQYRHFLAAPDYSNVDDRVNWYIDEWTEIPERLVELTGEKAARYNAIMENTVGAYRAGVAELGGEDLQVMACAMRYINREFVYCADGRVFLVAWGMTTDPNKHIPFGQIVHEASYIKRHTVRFEAGDHGQLRLRSEGHAKVADGTIIEPELIPEVVPADGYDFAGWTPSPQATAITADTVFTATYAKHTPVVVPPPVIPPVEESEPPVEEPAPDATVRFETGEHGTISGNAVHTLTAGTAITAAMIPTVKAAKGYKFTGWSADPVNAIANGDMVFTATYAKKKRRSLWKRWWWWLLLGLLFLLLCWLLSWLIPGCDPTFGCNRCGCIAGADEVNGVVPIDDDELDNVPVMPIDLDDDGNLPAETPVVAPPMHGDDGQPLPVIKEPNLPPVIANRLLLLIEDDNDNVDDVARDFKNVYPGDQYQIIDFDREVKSILIQIPENERATIREELPGKVGHNIIVIDDTMFELNGSKSTSSSADAPAGWHLKAINAQGGWKITKGTPSVRVAVVDDGIDASHPIFGNRIADAYNIFTGNNRLSLGDGHGTHVAGLAVGSQTFLSRGASGIAPQCTLIPVQIMQNGQTSLSAFIKGLMYAVHKDADVINASVGPDFGELASLPLEQQMQIVRDHFANEARLFNRVFEIASRKNTIIVLAAGNNSILSLIAPENRSDKAIVVGAVDPRLCPAEFSNFGPGTTISAPGVGILSSVPGGNLESMDGTSMAAPIVTGTVALMKTLKKDITVEQAANVLYRTGRSVNGPLPPMVLLPDALRGVQSGDFSRGPERQQNPLPEDVLQTLPPEQRNVVTIIENPEVAAPIADVIVGNPIVTTPPQDATIVNNPGTGNTPAPAQPVDNAKNYDELLALIAQLRQQLDNLYEQLPADHPARKNRK